MKITVTFDSMEEFQQYFQKPAEAPEAPKPEKKPQKPVDTGTGALRGATPEEMKQYEEEKKAPEVPFAEEPKATVEEVRKILADLNKAAGKNVAKDLIKAVGFKKLTEVTEGALPTLKSLAEEEARKYA